MNTPSFKPTKYDVYTCATCIRKYHSDAPYDYCVKSQHRILKRPNSPFFMKEMQIDGVWYKGWWHVRGPTEEESFVISPQNTALIIKGCGIEPGGFIRNQWWMFCKVGSAMSLKWMPVDKDEDVSK